MTTPVLAIGPTTTRTYKSVRAAARALSGTGLDVTERTRSSIRRKLNVGGGLVGRTYVEVK